MALITLDNRQLRLVLDPDQGVNVMAFSVQQRGAWLPVMPDARTSNGDPKASSFVMLPYSNRIEQGRFTFGGQRYQLANGERHASHGDTRARPWRVDRASRTQIHCTFDSRQHEQVNWPWPFTATIEYTLDGLTLDARITLTNQGESAMPAGTGWHPYFNRTLTQPGEPIEVQFTVTGVYPDANDNRIPSGPAEPLAPNQDFSTPKLLTPENFIDRCFPGYDGGGYFAWPHSGVKVSYQTSGCTHLVFFNPPKPYFAMEPVTNANNGVNLLTQGDPTSGIRVLGPGGSMAVRFAMQVELS
jgi:aldose 1-epimerase